MPSGAKWEVGGRTCTLATRFILDFGLELFLVIDRLLYGGSSVGRICILYLITWRPTQAFVHIQSLRVNSQVFPTSFIPDYERAILKREKEVRAH